MFPRRKLLPLAMVVLLGTVSAGCQAPARVVIQHLPRASILTPPQKPPAPATVEVVEQMHTPAPAQVPSSWAPTVHERPWQWIVIHHSATDLGSAALFEKAHRAKGWDEMGYHFVITNGRGGADGKVEVGSRWVKQKWGAHCGGTPNNEYNNYGIGVCLVGDFSERLPSPAQLASLRKLVFFLTERYGIYPACVIGHQDAPGAATACPGEHLHRHINVELRPELERRRQLAGR